MSKLFRVYAVACAAALTATGSAALAAGAPHTAIADCAGKADQAPRTLTLFCGDGNDTLTHLQWTGWGGQVATASAVDEINSCTPSCVAGRDRGYRVSVTAGQIERAGESARYRLLTVTFAATPPKGTPRVQRFDLTARGPVVK